MPIHDWTRVTAGTWHDFHLAWIAEIRNALNDGILPADHYAQAEQVTGPYEADILALQYAEFDDSPTAIAHDDGDQNGGVAVAVAPPKLRITAEADMHNYVSKRRTIVVRHTSGDRIVAFLEILSPGNKSTQHALQRFIEKAADTLQRGYHLTLIDLFPAGPRDPHGIHAELWREIETDGEPLPKEEPLTLAAYSAGFPKRAYVEPAAVGQTMIDLPLFLTPDVYVNVPLEKTYQGAYRGVPRRWRTVLEEATA